MANIIKVGSTSAGFTTTPDQSGELQIRTGQAAGGVTAMTIDASQNVSFAAALTAATIAASGTITSNGSPVATTGSFENSLTTTGYQKLPGGLIIQWLPAGTGVRSWSIPFPNAVFGAWFTGISAGGSTDNPYISTLSKTQVGLAQVNGTPNGYILGIGY